MLTASCPAGSALPMVGVSYQRSGWEWPRCRGAEAEGHLGAFEQVRMRMKSETSESSSTLARWSWSRVMVIGEAREEGGRHRRRIRPVCLISDGDAHRNAGATACGLRRAVLDLSIGHAQACPGTPSSHWQGFWPTFWLTRIRVPPRVHFGPLWRPGAASDFVAERRAAQGGLVVS